ncbi:MAG: tRNA (cytidine(34)-2'-O)-methyltransferase [Bacteriovoracaceae bacterium]|jgi:tRNA (cytidine/uridine-2'-O-)-methyltransferase|nr:tRNA (cytidine(34)-2'-O)-methyltransferase [Bacteriovoracaceae bacterium]
MPKDIKENSFKIVLYAPEIPGNTGSIGRTCLALDIRLILIKPYGFDLDEKAVRRAGLDYWKHVDLVEYESFDDFFEKEQPEHLYFMTKFAEKSYFDADFRENSYLIFGRETKGLPDFVPEKYPDDSYKLPMFSEHVRSLNLSNAATAVAYEALRQLS